LLVHRLQHPQSQPDTARSRFTSYSQAEASEVASVCSD